MKIMQELVEDALYVSQGKIPMYRKYSEYQCIYAWRLILTYGLIKQ